MGRRKIEDMPTTTGKTLREELTELYGWYVKQARAERDNRSPLQQYRAGKADGGAEAIGTVLLITVGGEEMMKIWEACLGENQQK